MSYIVVNKAGVEHRFALAPGAENDWINNFLLKDFAQWENETFVDFQRVNDSEWKIAIDIGAWVGTTAIWLSKHYDSVHVVEADPVSLIQLRANLEASVCSNVVVWGQPISDKEEIVYFGPNKEGTQCFNTSMSQIKTKRTSPIDTELKTITLEQIVAQCEKPIGLIKIDIEGGEENLVETVLKYAQLHKTCVHLSFHITWWENKDIGRYSEIFGEKAVQLTSLLRLNPFASIFFDYR